MWLASDAIFAPRPRPTFRGPVVRVVVFKRYGGRGIAHTLPDPVPESWARRVLVPNVRPACVMPGGAQ